MTDQHYTHTCQVCKTEYPAILKKDGSPRKVKNKTCSKRCYDSLRWYRMHGRTERLRAERKPTKDDKGNPLTCGVGGCDSIVFSGGMCAKHYYRVKLKGTTELKTARATLFCAECGKSVSLRPSLAKIRRFCSQSCASINKVKSSGKIYHGSDSARHSYYGAIRRSRIRNRQVEPIDPIKVFEESRWLCYLCGTETIKSKRGTTHPMAPELDHIVALANGGDHTLNNVACACRKCNLSKGSRPHYESAAHAH